MQTDLMAAVQETGLIIKVLAGTEEKEVDDELSSLRSHHITSLYNNRIK